MVIPYAVASYETATIRRLQATCACSVAAESRSVLHVVVHAHDAGSLQQSHNLTQLHNRQVQ
jgi:hypothetical protein